MYIEIPDVGQAIKLTDKNHRDILEKRIEKISAGITYNIKSSIIMGRYSAVGFVGGEEKEVIDKVMELYRKAGYEVIYNDDYIQVSWRIGE